jgi:hypothetical protein
MPRVGLSLPPSMAPPRAGSICAYLSLSALSVRLSHLHGRPEGEPSEHGIIKVSASTQFVGLDTRGPIP